MRQIKHEGLSKNRLSREPHEKVFAREWAVWNKRSRILDRLLYIHDDLSATEATQREATIAATVVQWLGSPIGMQFLRDTLTRCGVRFQE